MSEPSRSFLDRLAAEPITARGTECTIARALRKFAEADRAQLVASLLDVDGYTNRRIASAITASGILCGEQTVARHRRRGCRCPTSSTL